MAQWFELQNRLDEITKEYFKQTQVASNLKHLEITSVLKIQSFYRASKVREHWHAVDNATKLIQRDVRGWLARVRTRQKALELQQKRNSIFFHHCATVIQKYFIGWRQRKHDHDYYGRKAYLQKIQERGELTKAHLRLHHEKQLEEEKQRKVTQIRDEFDNLAGDLHHLISTKAIPGVYNPPYNDALPQAFGEPIEQHLRENCRVKLPKSLRRPRHKVLAATASLSPSRTVTRTALGATHAERAIAGEHLSGPPQDLPDRMPYHSRTASVGRLQKIQGPFRSREQIEVSNAKAANTYRSVQCTAPYDAVERDHKMQQRLSKLTRVSPVDFTAPGRPPLSKAPTSVHAATPYVEKGPETRNDYVELPKIRDKPPFFTAMPRDRQFEDYADQHLLPSGAV